MSATLPLKPSLIIKKPIPGDLFVVTKGIDIIDVKNNILSLKVDDIVTLLEIKDQNAGMRLDRKTRSISNWVCKFMFENRLFILKSQNSSQEALLFEYMELVTDDVAEALDQKQKRMLQ